MNIYPFVLYIIYDKKRFNMSYEIQCLNIINNAQYGLRANCCVYVIHVKINDTEQRIKNIIDTINDTSWYKTVADEDIKEGFISARDRTVKKLMEDIFNNVTLPVSVETGEYIISTTAQDTLVNKLEHKHIPLAELWKEKKSGNPGFDFHTISSSDLIVFGEAKFSKHKNPYGKGIEQVARFIEEKKDKYDKTFLLHFASKPSLDNFGSGNRAFCVAFSLNTCRSKTILSNAVKHIKKFNLDSFPELFVIGVEICQ